uniref:Sauvagine n=1 Tax=Agalychnis dacnicolor TaxID=75988 RepID=G7ZTY0_AGADC|nr:sauvagine precursor [Agalychnis dacnicolor]
MKAPSSVTLLACFLILLGVVGARPLKRKDNASLVSDPMKRQGTSLDLTFDLLRHNLEIAKQEALKKQAAKNRLLLDTIGE